MKKPIVLTILDGCGIREETDGNAFKNANKPTFDYLWNNYPHTLLEASGKTVGLPKGQMGNSEVGHMNIGAGRLVYQPLELINHDIETKEIYNNQELLNIINHVKQNNSNLHIMGLLSDGGVHSHINHLKAIINLCKQNNVEPIYDFFLDGRDVNPKSALTYLDEINNLNYGKINTISGRYYAMDRDNNFDRLKLAYDAIVYSKAPKFDNYKTLIEDSYNKDITDEFIIPSIINENKLNDNDGVIAFNFRKDRLRELFTLLTNPNEYERDAKEKNLEIKHFNNLKCLTMLPVVESVKCPHAYDDPNLENILGDYLFKNNKNQLRIAETEKYAHVTFFFDGGIEKEYPTMKKILVPSPKVATYDLQPQMSAGIVTDKLIEELNTGIYDIIILNFANGDMVGHTGVYEAAKTAVEYLDTCLKRIYDKVSEMDGIMIITADHGNCDIMWDENHTPVTSHTTSPVPFIITKKYLELTPGKLGDIAPTILKLMDMQIPSEMTGNILIK